jgi:hypothetical protein
MVPGTQAPGTLEEVNDQMKSKRMNVPTPAPTSAKKRYALAALAVAGAVAIGSWWGSKSEDVPDIAQTSRSERAAPRPPSPFVSQQFSPTHTPTIPSPEKHRDPALVGYTSQKYQLLLAHLFDRTTATDELSKALLAREKLAVALNTSRQAVNAAEREKIPEQEAALARHDELMRTLLHPTDYARFEDLKESDLEQFQLNDYADGIANVAPLSPDDRRLILLTKLNYKRYFRQVLLDSGLMRSDLSAADREYAYAFVSRALEEYKQSYLQEVRQYLTNEEQYALLSNYETTEFTTELAKLRSMASGS